MSHLNINLSKIAENLFPLRNDSGYKTKFADSVQKQIYHQVFLLLKKRFSCTAYKENFAFCEKKVLFFCCQESTNTCLILEGNNKSLIDFSQKKVHLKVCFQMWQVVTECM